MSRDCYVRNVRYYKPLSDQVLGSICVRLFQNSYVVSMDPQRWCEAFYRNFPNEFLR